ncbi:MAG: hypothetical protein B6U89_00940, partial [Desulfurococcales archaeon ex4484_58]
KLTKVHRLGYYSVVEEDLGIAGKFKLPKYLEVLKKHGFSFTAKIDYHRIGLSSYFIFIFNKVIDFKELPYLSWLHTYVITYNPLGTLIEYYIPIKYRKKLVKDIHNKFDEKYPNLIIEDVFIIGRERRQPSFSRYNFSEHPLITGYSLSYLKNKFTELLSEHKKIAIIDEEELEENITGLKDLVDLLILKEFEANAFTMLTQISEKYGFESAHLRKHLFNHIFRNRLIEGVFLKSKIFIDALSSPLLLFIETNDQKVFRALIGLMQELECTIGLGYSSEHEKPYKLVVSHYRTLHGFEDFKKFLLSLYSEGLIDKIIATEYIVPSFKKFTIPYMNFYQELRDWSLDTLKTHIFFGKRILRRGSLNQ